MEEIRIKATIDVTQATASAKQLTSQIRNVSNEMKKGVGSSKEYASSLNTLTKGLRSYISAYAAIHYAMKGRDVLAEVETGFINIQKTTNLTGIEFKELKEGIFDLANTMGGVTTMQLQEIAAIAGQLGVKGKEDILNFSSSIAKIGLATDLTVEKAATGMAIFENIMKEPVSRTEALGSVMNELSNTSTATAFSILEFSKRLAGAGKTLGLTSDEVMGISATLSDIGVRIEGGGSALSRVFQRMLKDQDKFAAASKKTIEQYSRDITESPKKAFVDLIKAFSQLAPTDLLKTLSDLGINSDEMTSALLKLSTASGKLQKNLSTAHTEMQRGTSLQIEYSRVATSFKSKMADLNDSFVQLVAAIGVDLLPVLKSYTNNMIKAVNLTKEFYVANKELIGVFVELVSLAAEFYLAGKVFKVIKWAKQLTFVKEIAGVRGLSKAFTSLGNALKSKDLFTIGGLVAGFEILKKVATGEVISKDNQETFRLMSEEYDKQTGLIDNYNIAVQDETEFIKLQKKEHQEYIGTLKQSIENNDKLIAIMKKNPDNLFASEIEKLTNRSKELNEILKETEKRKPIGTEYADIVEKYNATVFELSDTIKMSNIELDLYKEKVQKALEAEKNRIIVLEKKNELTGKESEYINEATQKLKRYEEILSKINKLEPAYKEDLIAIDDKQQAQVDSYVKKYQNRVNAHKNSLLEIYKKEEKLKSDLEKLEEEKQKIYKKYADMRLELHDRIEDKIRKATQKGMGDFEKYNDNQAVADKKLAQAKDYLLKGNAEQAKRYLQEYYSLVDEYAGDEITKDSEIRKYNSETKKWETESIKQVQATRSATLAEYQRDLKAGAELEQRLIKIQEQEEIKVHNEKINMKKIELQAVKAEMEAQRAIVELFVKMVNMGKEVAFVPDFTEFEKAVKGIDDQLAALQEKKRDVRIDVDADTTKATDKIEEINRKITINKTTIDVYANTTPADFGIQKLITVTEGDAVNLIINPEWEKAQAQIDSFRNGEEKKEIKPKFVLEIRDAEQKVDEVTKDTQSTLTIKANDTEPKKAIQELGKGSISEHKIGVDANRVHSEISRLERDTHSTHYIKVKTIESHSSGGLIGHFSSGGFAKKSGKIPGHDLSGSDDVKAMLTRGEYVHNVKAVDYYGLSFMQKLNALKIPKFSSGGIVDARLPKYASGGSVSSSQVAYDRTVNINFRAGGRTFSMYGEEDVANALAKYLERGEF